MLFLISLALLIGGVASCVYLVPSDWQVERADSRATLEPLIAEGFAPTELPASSTDIAISYNAETGHSFVTAIVPLPDAVALRQSLIPAGGQVAADLASRHPENLAEWDETQIAARLRGGIVRVQRPRDGSRRYFGLDPQQGGNVLRLYYWNAPDIMLR